MESRIIRCTREDQIAIVEAILDPPERNEYLRESVRIAHKLFGDTMGLQPGE